MHTPYLSFDINKHFPGFSINCKATFDTGVTAIFGPSGSGKSTILHCLSGLIAPDEGEILVSGQTLFSSLSGVNVPPEKRQIGYILQNSTLFPHMNVRENIAYGYKLTPTHRRKISPESLVELLELSTLMDRKISNLSGGEKQKVALARSLATSPKLILLDEPFASLDERFRGVIIDYLKRIWLEFHTPMVYVSHSISEVMALAGNTLALMKGKQVAYGRTSQVLVDQHISAITDYTTLENLLDATIISQQNTKGLADLKVGKCHLKSPRVTGKPGDKLMISIRAGDIILALDAPVKLSARNILRATINKIHILEHRVLVYLDIGTRLIAEVTLDALMDLNFKERQQVHLIIKTNSIHVLEGPLRLTDN